MIQDQPLRILLIEDSEDDGILMLAELKAAGLNLVSKRVEDEAGLRAALQEQTWNIILTDYTMPRFNALQALSIIKEMQLDTPCIVVSGTIGEETAVTAMKAGAVDYFMKGRLQRLPSAMERHLAEHKMRQEKKRAFEKMRVIERRFQIMADCAPVLIWMSDATTNSTFFNKGWLDFTGRSLEEEYGKGWTKSLHPDDFEEVMQTYLTAFHARQEYKMEYRLKRQDGEYRWLMAHGMPRFEENNKFTGYIGTCMDITERKLAEAEREAAWQREMAARQEAERLNRIKDEFLATLSHELRTPMHAITGWAELLSRQLLDEQEAAEAATAIYQSAQAQNQLISDLLDISGMISGKVHLDAAPLDIIHVIHSCLETIRLSAEAKEIDIQLHSESKISAIKGDATRFKQVIWNLLSNAIKFTPKHGQIDIHIRRQHSNVEIEVKDNGEGIETDFLPHVFDRFSQSDSSLTRRHGGLGIGLSIVRHLVELHGGQVEAYSLGKNQGASFIIRLPVLSVAQSQNSKKQADERKELFSQALQNEGNFSEKKLEKLKILVVDDQPDVIGLVKAVLQRQGAEVITAASVCEALKAFEVHQPDLLLSDIGMPYEDGYDLIRKIRSQQSGRGGSIPAVALSAHIQEDVRQKALNAGFHTHLAKPIDASSLVETLAQLSQIHAPTQLN
ncbi:MAG: response regulator [Oligoflexus sp.]